MSKKQMIPFLTEWLINYGTNPTDTSKMLPSTPVAMLIRARRLGYLADVSSSIPIVMKLTKKGILFLQENQK